MPDPTLLPTPLPTSPSRSGSDRMRLGFPVKVLARPHLKVSLEYLDAILDHWPAPIGGSRLIVRLRTHCR